MGLTRPHPPTLQIAKRQAVVNPENTFFSVKRFIGRKAGEVGEETKQVPYRVSACCHNRCMCGWAHLQACTHVQVYMHVC